MDRPSKAELFPRIYRAVNVPVVPVDRVRPHVVPPECLAPAEKKRTKGELQKWQSHYMRTLPGTLPAGMVFRNKLSAVAYIAARWRLPINVLTGLSRSAYCVAARREAAWVLVRRMGYSLSEAGRALNRDHKTVMNLVETYDALLAGKGVSDGNV
jgi:hypothetical protein